VTPDFPRVPVTQILKGIFLDFLYKLSLSNHKYSRKTKTVADIIMISLIGLSFIIDLLELSATAREKSC
jgi:hypothetical protein